MKVFTETDAGNVSAETDAAVEKNGSKTDNKVKKLLWDSYSSG